MTALKKIYTLSLTNPYDTSKVDRLNIKNLLF